MCAAMFSPQLAMSFFCRKIMHRVMTVLLIMLALMDVAESMDSLFGDDVDDQRPRQRARKGPSHTDIAALLLLVAKLSLSSAQQVRVLRAITIDNWRFKASTLWITKGIAVTKSYATKAKQDYPQASQRDQQLLSMWLPHGHLWNAILIVAKEKTQQGSDAHNKLTQFIESANTRAIAASSAETVKREPGRVLQAMAEGVKHVRISKMFDAQYKRLEITTVEGSDADHLYRQILVPLWKADHATRQEGTAPSGNLERQIQQIISEMEPNSGPQ